MSERELGWLEAAIDGEGTLTLHRNKYSRPVKRGFAWVPRLMISNTNLEFLNRARAIIGGGSIQSNRRKTPRKTCYALVVTSNPMRLILPQLRLIIKERHRVLLLEALALITQVRPVKPEADARLEEIYQEIRRLNR